MQAFRSRSVLMYIRYETLHPVRSLPVNQSAGWQGYGR